MLGLDFEEFELISSKEELWILESREEIFSDEEIIKYEIKLRLIITQYLLIQS